MDLSSYSIDALIRRRPLTPTSSFYRSNDEDSDVLQTPPKLKRTLGLLDVIFYGVGCSVGAGIYSLVGIGAHLAGPSIAISFLLCGLACCFTSLAYAEFAARVPLAGSAYTFTYVTFGELFGWLVGWNLTLGYAVSAAVVARSWSEYVVGFLAGIPSFQSNTTIFLYISWLSKFPIKAIGEDYSCCPLSIFIIGVCTLVLITGVKESTRFNTIMTLLNLSVLAFVLLSGIGSGSICMENLQPIFPHGISGMARGAGLVFFSYLGFDMVACLSEECKNPERNMPIGIVGSLGVSMLIYVSISVAIVGMVPPNLLGEDVPMIDALLANACCEHKEQMMFNREDSRQSCISYSCSPILSPILYYGSQLVSFGAIFGLTTATFACLMGQPRINFAAAQDGLLCKMFAEVNPRTGVPTTGTVITGVITAFVACFVELEALANAISLGTLQVFTFVNAGVILLRMRPDIMNDSNNNNDITVGCKSPIVRDKEAAKVVRSLGLIKRSSREIRSLMRRRSRESSSPRVDENGVKPAMLVVTFSLSSIILSLAFSNDWTYFVSITCGIFMFLSATLLFMLPKITAPETFSCPFVPAVPLMGILLNSIMMGFLPSETWTIISVWLFLGLLFYFTYGIHHSELKTTSTKSSKKSIEEIDQSKIFYAELKTGIDTKLLLKPNTVNYDAINF